MIKVMSIKANTQEKTAHVELFADTKTEVTDDVAVSEIPVNYDIEMGSAVVTASGDVAFRKSDGTWNWL